MKCKANKSLEAHHVRLLSWSCYFIISGGSYKIYVLSMNPEYIDGAPIRPFFCTGESLGDRQINKQITEGNGQKKG